MLNGMIDSHSEYLLGNNTSKELPPSPGVKKYKHK